MREWGRRGEGEGRALAALRGARVRVPSGRISSRPSTVKVLPEAALTTLCPTASSPPSTETRHCGHTEARARGGRAAVRAAR